jgi:hypothetical protein
MTAELGLCLFFLVVAIPVSRSIAAHYLLLVIVNVSMLGFTSADASLLAAMFVSLAIADALLFMWGGRPILLLPAAAASALAIESMLNMDWLLTNIVTINAAVNAIIAANLVKGYLHWTHRK